jgi:Tol biopolymer transport system component
MKRKPRSKRKFSPKSILRLPDLEAAKSAVLNSLSCADAQQGYLSLTTLDRNGKRVETIGEPADLFDAVYSPDRKSIAAVVTDASGGGSTSDIWTYDARRGLRTRFTFGPAIHNTAVWSPDGRTMAFFSYEKLGVYRKPTDGSADAFRDLIFLCMNLCNELEYSKSVS